MNIQGTKLQPVSTKARRVRERGAPLAVRLAKEAMLRSFEVGLDSGLNFERKSFSLLAASGDRREGIAAFLEKRAAQFSGK